MCLFRGFDSSQTTSPMDTLHAMSSGKRLLFWGPGYGGTPLNGVIGSWEEAAASGGLEVNVHDPEGFC